MNLLTFTDFSFEYALGECKALQNINLDINDGKILVVCGKSGSGKSTLIRCMKKEITPAGNITGKVDTCLASNEIAIVFQDTDTQLVNQTVIDDLVFYMENLQYDSETMKKNMAETVTFFGLESLLHKKNTELSGGEKQLVALCAALMTRPKLLLLDEPTAQLDPISARGFWDTVFRIHEEFGISMVITEHRLDEVMVYAHEVAMIENGSIKYMGETKEVFSDIYSKNDADEIKFIPDVPRLCLNIGVSPVCFTPAEFRQNMNSETTKSIAKNELIKRTDKPVLSMKNVFFAYESSSDFVLRNLSFELRGGEKICLLGGNGSGKTTLLKMLCKIIKPLSGTVSAGKNKPAYMPQDIKSYFRFETVEEELSYSGNGEINHGIASKMGLTHLFGRHPFDLSGGEAQKLVLACIFTQNPDIIVMDEPTKGLDPCAKEELSQFLKDSGATIVMATHDIRFAADFAERCVMLFDGGISLSAAPQDFFSYNQYYTTSINRSIRHMCPHAVTLKEALSLWQ